MSKRFFTQKEFNENYGKEMASAVSVYERMTGNGFREDALAAFDIEFISDKKEKVIALGDFLQENYDYTIKTLKKQSKQWLLEGDAKELPYNEDSLLFWAVDLYCKGYEYDCKLNGYGALTDPNSLVYLDTKDKTADDFHKDGINAVRKRNFGAAIIYFTVALQLDHLKAKSWHAQGYCKDELFAWKAARRDYEKALEIEPDDIDTLLSLATNKDKAGEHTEALIIYDKALCFEPDNKLAYFNRGNTKFSLGDRDGACKDWNQAKMLGSPYAQERIDMECMRH